MTRLRRLFQQEPHTAAQLLVQPVHAPGLRGEWLARPGGQGRHCMLYLHGDADMPGASRAAAGRIALAAGIPALLLDYRRPPAHPRSIAVNDAIAAWRGLLARGFDAANLAIAGDAAGNGPATAMLAVLREASLPTPGLTCLLAAADDAEIERAARAIRSWKGGG